MYKNGISLGLTLGVVTLISACAGAPRTPSESATEAVDLNAFEPRVDNFVVLLDTSDSMDDGGAEGDKFQTALDRVASFNQAIPDIDLQAGLVLFGKGVGNCTGHAMARQTYGMTAYDKNDFRQAISPINCIGGGTPIGDALDLAASGLPEAGETTAVFIFSDFKWSDPGSVRTSVASMKEQHGDNLCLYAIKVGDDSESDTLINELINVSGCGGVVPASELASAEAMTAYAARTLMSPAAAPLVEYEQQTLSGTALFNLDSAVLSGAGQTELSELAAYINGHESQVSDIKVVGHTCDLGSEVYNQGLSLRRARAVAAFLAQEGVPSELMDVSGMGESNPIASNDSKAGRSQNRRVEVHIGTIKPLGS